MLLLFTAQKTSTQLVANLGDTVAEKSGAFYLSLELCRLPSPELLKATQSLAVLAHSFFQGPGELLNEGRFTTRSSVVQFTRSGRTRR